MIDGRFDQHFLEIFAGTSNREVSPAPLVWAVALVILIALVIGFGPDWLPEDRQSASTLGS